MKFYIETYGCTANMGNSQDLAEALQENGHVPASLDDADAVIVNTCAVTEKTERKILRRLKALQGVRLVVGGCLSAALPESICGILCKRQLGLLKKESAAEIADLFSNASSSPLRLHSRRQKCSGIINIAEGCNGRCSYCIVRRARGMLASRRPAEVMEAARQLADQGIAEIQLAAQDTASYGDDIGSNLPELLNRVTSLPGDFMVRVGMMNPGSVMPNLMEMIMAFRNPKVFKFLHIPIQSGSDEVLKRMDRRYSVQDFIHIVKAFRSSMPDISINTDVIVGFPSETEDDFLKTIDVIRAVEPDKVNVTRFSQRPGTAAARLYDMPDRFKKERSRELTRLWQEIAEMRNRCLLGSTVVAIVTEMGKDDAVIARTENYREIVVHRSLDLGGVHRFKIVRICPFYLEGEIESRE